MKGRDSGFPRGFYGTAAVGIMSLFLTIYWAAPEHKYTPVWWATAGGLIIGLILMIFHRARTSRRERVAFDHELTQWCCKAIADYIVGSPRGQQAGRKVIESELTRTLRENPERAGEYLASYVSAQNTLLCEVLSLQVFLRLYALRYPLPQIHQYLHSEDEHTGSPRVSRLIETLGHAGGMHKYDWFIVRTISKFSNVRRRSS